LQRACEDQYRGAMGGESGGWPLCYGEEEARIEQRKVETWRPAWWV